MSARLVLTVCIPLLLTLVLASVAPAEVVSNIQVPIALIVDIPCAGESVALTGTLHIVSTVTIDANGGFHLTDHANPQGLTGTGLISGVKYQGTGVTRSNINADVPLPFETTFVNNFRIIGAGPGNNLLIHANIHMTVNANGTVTANVSNVRSDCK